MFAIGRSISHTLACDTTFYAADFHFSVSIRFFLFFSVSLLLVFHELIDRHAQSIRSHFIWSYIGVICAAPKYRTFNAWIGNRERFNVKQCKRKQTQRFAYFFFNHVCSYTNWLFFRASRCTHKYSLNFICECRKICKCHRWKAQSFMWQ